MGIGYNKRGLHHPVSDPSSITTPLSSLFRESSHERVLRADIRSLLLYGTIEEVLESLSNQVFCYHYFLVTKKDGGSWQILDLWKLSKYIWTVPVQDGDPCDNYRPSRPSLTYLESLANQISRMLISILTENTCRFSLGQEHFQYRPFSLSTALRVFTKCLSVIAAFLRRWGFFVFP